MADFTDDIFFTGGANSDDDPKAIPKGDWRTAHNFSLGDPYGYGASLVNSRGTRIVPNDVILPADVIVGVCDWIEANADANAIVYLVYADVGSDQIWVYDIDTETHQLASESGDYNFDPAWTFYHMNVIDNILKFTDGRWDDLMYDPNGNRLFNPPYQINLRKALDGEYSVITLQVIDAIKWPPKEPSVVYDTDTNQPDNKLNDDLYKFRVQYIYENNEPSVLSHYSNLALPTNSQYVSGNDVLHNNADNVLKVTFNTGPQVVKKINVAYSKNDLQFGIFLQIDKAQDGYSDDQNITIDFFGNTASKPIETDNYDGLPIVADCQEFLPSKELAYVSFREGYDKVEIDVTIEQVLTEIDVVYFFPTLESQFIGVPPGYLRFNWDDNSTFSALAGQTFTVYVTLTTESDLSITLSYTVTQDDVNVAINEATPQEQMGYILEVIVTAYVAQMNVASDFDYSIDVVGDYDVRIERTDGSLFAATISFGSRPVVLSDAVPSLKTGATHQFGIEYFDRAERDGTVLTSDPMTIFVPFPPDEDLQNFFDVNNPYRVNPRFLINHIPPVWADYFRFVARPVLEIETFMWVTLVDIAIDNGRYKLSLDFFYNFNYRGTSPEMVPQEGDILRPIRKQPTDSTDPLIPYIDESFELQVLGYSDNEGLAGTRCVWVPFFEAASLFQNGATNNDAGQLVEIYRPRPTLNTETGTLFVSQWKVISERFDIINPHTDERVHGGSSYTGLVGELTEGSDTYFLLNGDFTVLLGYDITIYSTEYPGFYDVGPVLTATYDSTTNITTITAEPWPNFSSTLGGGFVCETLQNALLDVPAQIDSSWGDVYVRLRPMTSSFPPSPDSFFYRVESFEFTDYKPSNIHQYGEIAAESPYAKMVYRMATAKHSASYVDASQVNGLSTFRLSFDNIQDLNDQFGPVRRAIMDGKTLKCIQKRKENSIYVQGSFSVTADGLDAPFANSGKTFASWRPSPSLSGTDDPNSVVLIPNGESTIAYWDRTSGAFILSANNGQINISKRAKFVKRSLQIKNLYTQFTDVICRAFIDETQAQIGWCFSYNAETQFEIVTFNYDRMRFVEEHDYNFRFFMNSGQYLVGFGVDNQLYVHNQNTFTLHGENFTSDLTFVSNENGALIKRFQDIVEKSTSPMSVYAFTEPNDVYGVMETTMPLNLLNPYEGHFATRFRRNKNYITWKTDDWNFVNGNEMRAGALTITCTYLTSDNQKNIVVFGIKITGNYSETIQ